MSKPTIKLGGVTVPADLKGRELLKFLKENKATLLQEKKSELKRADAVSVSVDIASRYFIDKEGRLSKAAADQQPAPPEGAPQTALCVINTTNWLDSHLDCHIPGLWKKSLSDNKLMLHLQEHVMAFDHVISDESKGYTEKLTWKELGIDLPGVTEALIFATPLTGRCPFMDEQYKKGYVKNHSVGMRYVSLKLCINEPEDEYYKEEYANWVTYAPMVANIEDAEAVGFFWAVLEAKVVEGSAVVKGSNVNTPCMGLKSAQPADATEPNQPTEVTGGKEDKTPNGVDYEKIANHLFQI